MTKKKTDQEINKGGRPTLFKEEYCEQVYKLCLLGAKDTEIADFFGIAVSTLNLWKDAQPKFMESLKAGKAQADAEVARSLFHRAKGFKGKDVKFATHEGAITDSQEYEREYPPDTTACIFWLKNRQPELWRDKVQQEHSNPDGTMRPVVNITIPGNGREKDAKE